LTKTTDSPESPSKPAPKKCCVQRRLKDGTYSKENESLVSFWLDWHYFPLNHLSYTTVFSSDEEAKKHIEEQKIEWPNFDYKIIILDK